MPPTNGFVERQGDRAIIVCESTNTKLEILCNDGEWQGDFSDCPESKTCYKCKTSFMRSILERFC